MSDFVGLVKANELALTEIDQKRISKLFMEKAVTYLSPEREMGVFLLYSIGDDLETIAVKTNLPRDIILATAIHYRWPEKVKYLQKDALNPVFLQKELANTLLVATYQAMIRDLGQVIAGTKESKEVGLIPKNMAALQNLMDMVSKLNTIPSEPVPQAPGQSTTVIHASGPVQVNNQLPQGPVAPAADDPKRIAMLKAIDE